MSCMECLVFQKPQKWMGCWRLSVKHKIKLGLGGGIIASAIIDWCINSLNDDQRRCIHSLTCWVFETIQLSSIQHVAKNSRYSHKHKQTFTPYTSSNCSLTFHQNHQKASSPVREEEVCDKSQHLKTNQTQQPSQRGNDSTTSIPQGFPNREKGMSCQYLTKRVLMPIGHEEFRTCKPNIFDWCCLAWLFYLLKIAQNMYTYVYYINSWWFTWFFHRVSNQFLLFFPNHLRASRGQVPFLVSAISLTPWRRCWVPLCKSVFKGAVCWARKTTKPVCWFSNDVKGRLLGLAIYRFSLLVQMM